MIFNEITICIIREGTKRLREREGCDRYFNNVSMEKEMVGLLKT